MRCLYYSYCNEPKYLCCNFCSKKDCEDRCKDDHTSCKLYEQGPVEISEDKPNHIIKKRKVQEEKEKLTNKNIQIKEYEEKEDLW